MPDIDEFASQLLEEAKRFLEKADAVAQDDVAREAYLHAALMVGFCALEAQVNAVADDMMVGHGLTVHERAILQEKDVKLEFGRFSMSKGLKIFRLEDRFLFLCSRFSAAKLDRTASWWSSLRMATELRNELTHPKAVPTITVKAVADGLRAIVEAINQLYMAVYKRPFPAANRQLQSKLDF